MSVSHPLDGARLSVSCGAWAQVRLLNRDRRALSPRALGSCRWPALSCAISLAQLVNVWALPRGVAIYQTFLAYDRSQTMEERLAPFVPAGTPSPRP